MSKYKNKDGISLNYAGDDSHKVLVREVIREAIRILNSHAMSDSQSKSWAIDRGISFLEENFDIKDEIFSKRNFDVGDKLTEQGWGGEL